MVKCFLITEHIFDNRYRISISFLMAVIVKVFRNSHLCPRSSASLTTA